MTCSICHGLCQAYSSGHAVSGAATEEPAVGPGREVIGSKMVLGPECKNFSADVLPVLQLQQSWKPGRFMQDPKYDYALVTQLGMERWESAACNLPDDLSGILL